MNNIVIGVLLLLLFTYCGGSSVPPFLKDNKKYLLGFAAGLAGYPLMRIEGAGKHPYDLTVGGFLKSLDDGEPDNVRGDGGGGDGW